MDFTNGYCGKRSECNNNNMISVKSSSIVHIHIYNMAVIHNVISFLQKLYTNFPSALSVGIYFALIYQHLLTKLYKHKYLATELSREGNKQILKGCVLGFWQYLLKRLMESFLDSLMCLESHLVYISASILTFEMKCLKCFVVDCKENDHIKHAFCCFCVWGGVFT